MDLDELDAATICYRQLPRGSAAERVRCMPQTRFTSRLSNVVALDSAGYGARCENEASTVLAGSQIITPWHPSIRPPNLASERAPEPAILR